MVSSKNVCFIFPGQGAQFVGMGKDLYSDFSSARNIYDKADDILGYSIKKICFEGPEDELIRTQISQPAILTTTIAILKALEERGFNLRAKYVTGLSLGEYSALISAGSLSFEEGLRLVAKRANFMYEASLKNPGKMASVIGLSKDEVAKIADLSKSQMVNFNCPGQIVLSGSPESIEKAKDLAEKMGARRFILLKVSGAFHSNFMDEASQRLKQELDRVELAKPELNIVFNVTAQTEDDPLKIKENLSSQINHATYWQKSIEYIQNRRIDTFLEMGPGKVLRGLLRRINSELKVYNVGNSKDIDRLEEEEKQWF